MSGRIRASMLIVRIDLFTPERSTVTLSVNTYGTTGHITILPIVNGDGADSDVSGCLTDSSTDSGAYVTVLSGSIGEGVHPSDVERD